MADFFDDLMEESAGESAVRTSRRDESLILSLWREVISRLMAVMVKLQRKQSQRDNSNQTKSFLMLTVCMTLNVLQLISLATSCDLSAEEFVFWSILRYTRLEWIAYKTVSLWDFIMLTQAVVLTQVCVLVVAMASLKFVPILHHIAVVGLKAATHPSFSVVVIPFQMALFTSIKYTFSSKTAVLEFEDLPVASLNVNGGTCLLSMVCLVSLLTLEYIKLVSNTHIGYGPHTNYFRFTAYFDLTVRLGFSFLVGLYFFNDLMHPIAFRGITAAVGLYLALKVREVLPYYIARMNYLYFALCTLLMWAAAAGQIGEMSESLMTSFYLMMLVSPLLILGSFHILQKQLDQAEAEAGGLVTSTKDLKEFELSLRLLARKASTPEAFDALMNHFINFRARCREVHKMLDICEVYFCIDALNNNKLALVKHARLHRPGFSFEAKFHEACIKEYLESCMDLGEEKEYLEFKTLFDQTKRCDEEATLISYRLWYEFTLQKPNSDSIDNSLDIIYEAANDVRLRYEQIIQRFPEAKGVYELYQSFVTTVIANNDPSKTLLLVRSKISVQEESKGHQNLRNFNLFDDSCGLMMIDASPDHFGRITHANNAALRIFGVQRAMFIGSDLSDYIPPPIRKNHTKKMLNFVTNCTNTDVELPFNVFICNGKRFLRDCRIIARLSAFESYPVFVVSIIDLPITREVAIVDDQGVIYAHSEFLPKVLDQHQDRLEGRSIEELLPINFQNLELFKAFEVRKHDTLVKMAAAILSVHKVSIKLLFFFTNDDEFLRWKLEKHQQDIADLTKLYQVDLNKVDMVLASPAQARRGEHRSASTAEHLDANKQAKSQISKVQEEDSSAKNLKDTPVNQNSSNASGNSQELRRQHRMVESFMSALNLSRMTMLITTLALVLASIAMLVYLTVSVERIDQVFILQMLNGFTYEFLKSGFASRMLMLANEGNPIYDTEEVRSMLSTSSDNLRDLLRDLNDNKAIIEGYGFDKLYNNDFIRSWHLENGDPVMGTKNLVELAEDFIMSTSAAASLDIEECTLSNKYLYLNYRNGLGEAFTSLNITSHEYIEKQHTFMKVVGSNLLVIIGVSGAVLILCFALVIPSVVYLQRTYDQFWEQLANISVQKAQDLKFDLVRRANNLFDPETIEELKNSYSMDFRRVRNGDKTLPKVRIVIWKKAALKLSMFLAFSGMLFAIFYSVCFVNVRETLEHYQSRIHVGYQVKIGFLRVTVCSEENNFTVPTLDTGVPNYIYTEAIELLEDSIERLDYILLSTYDSKFTKVNFDKKSMLKEDFGSTNPYFHHGLQPALINTFQNIRAYQEQDAKYSEGDLEQVIAVNMELDVLENEIILSIVDATKVEVDKTISTAEIITSCYAAGVLALSFAVYKRMFDSLGEKLRRNLSVIRLILS
jgi:PAS domain-containing protein